MRLLAIAAGALCGLALTLVVDLPLLAVLGLVPLVLCAAIFSRRRWLLLTSLLMFGVLIGASRGELSNPDEPRVVAGSLVRQEMSLEGVARDAPSDRGQLTRVRVRLVSAHAVGDPGSATPVTGDAIAWLYPPAFSIGAGDRVLLTGTPELPAPQDDAPAVITPAPAGDLVIVTRPNIRLLARAPWPMTWLNALREGLSASLERSLPSPQAELARALVLGQRDALPYELTEQWRRAGTAHLLAISGLHVSVVLGVTLVGSSMLIGRRRNLHVILPLVLIWAYAVLSGLNPPVVRAAIMGSVYLLAITAGWQPSGGLALFLAAAALALWDPSIITTVSFQMTVAAMAGIIFLTEPIEALIRAPFGGREGATPAWDGAGGGGWRRFGVTGVSASLGAVIGIKPLLLHYFGAISLFTIPASLLGTLALPPVLVTSTLTSVIGLNTDGLIASFVGWLAWPWLTWLITVSAAFSAPPFAAVTIPPLSAGAVVLIYTAIIAAFSMPVLGRRSGLLGPMVALPGLSAPGRRRILTSWPALGALAVLAAVAGIGAAAPVVAGVGLSGDRTLSVHVLDVGQGDSILITSPTGRRVLIDGGPDGALLQARLAEHLPWWSRRIDAIILTHPSADHIIGLTETVRRFRVGMVIDPQLESGTRYGTLWEQALREHPDMRAVYAERGTMLNLGGGAMLEILHPPAPRPFDTAEEHDDNSVVARVTYGAVSFLLAADIYAPAEGYLLETDAPLRATVLKVAHQGSRYASTPEFLRAVSPKVAVISAGEGNRFGHPHPETLTRLAELPSPPVILRTDQQGTVTLTTDGASLKWWPE